MEKLTENFLLDFIKFVLKRDENYLIVIPHLNTNHIPNDSMKTLVETIIRYRKTNGKLPKLSYLELTHKKEPKVLEIIDRLLDLDDPDEEGILTGFEEFIKRVRFIHAYAELGDLFNRGKKELAYKKFNKLNDSITNFSLQRARVEQVFDNFERRVVVKNLQKMTNTGKFTIPTEIDELNTHIVYESGEYFLWLGDSGTGKSTMLIGQGVHGARLGFNTLHVSAEGTKTQLLDRYDACWTGALYKDVKHNNFDDEKFAKRYLKTARSVAGEIYVESVEKFSERPKVANIRALLYNFRKQGIVIHQVLIDYLELFQPTNEDYDNEEQRQGLVSRDFKDLAVEFNCVVGSVTQAQRISREFLNDPNFLITRDKIGESYSKIKPTDHFLTINQTSEEKKAHKARIYIDKAREHAGNEIIRFYQALQRSRFYDRRKTLNSITTKGLQV